jgi:uncharacterized phiE125 gp8 family phage protein
MITDLVTLSEAKTHLEINTSIKDGAINSMIAGVSLQLENWCRTPLVQRDWVERYTAPLVGAIWLRKYPVVSITSIGDDAANSIPATDYRPDKLTGRLRHFSSWPLPFDTNGLVSEWIITYKAGRWSTTATVPFDAKLACFMQIAHLFPRKSPGIASISTGALSLSFRDSAGLIPEVCSIMARYKGNHI